MYPPIKTTEKHLIRWAIWQFENGTTWSRLEIFLINQTPDCDNTKAKSILNKALEKIREKDPTFQSNKIGVPSWYPIIKP
jgi:hypothetical protein